ncbi:MAG TPA: FMN-binding protein [Clostridia bacterium]|nr:FMN-binding protein [Clostridia bacterium]
MKKILKKITIFISFLFIVAIGLTFYLSRGTDSYKSIHITDVNMNALSDGIYTGHYSEGRWKNTVEVTINNGQIKAIRPIQRVVFEKKEVSNIVFERVIKEQKISVDTISGATITSKAYLKSIENALNEKK